MADSLESRQFSAGEVSHFQESGSLVVMGNTSKKEKLLWSGVLLGYLGHGVQAIPMLEVLTEQVKQYDLAHLYDEATFDHARNASEDKAGFISGKLFEKVTAYGADSTFWIWDEVGQQWSSFHKLERKLKEGINPAKLIAGRYRRLRDLMVLNPSGKVRVAWELSSTFENGKSDTLSEFLLMEFKSFEREFLWQKISEAVTDGGIYKKAPGISFLEAVFESDKKAKLGFFNVNDFPRRGLEVWSLLSKPDNFIRRLAMEAVLNTVPLGLLESEEGLQVFEKAFEISKQIGEGWK